MSHQAIVNGYFEASADFWRDVYEQPDVLSQIYQMRYRRVLAQIDQIGIAHGSRVLEVGCGAGHTTVALAQRGFVVEALDAARGMADATRDRAAQAGLATRVRAQVGDVNHLPYQDSEFLFAVAIGVLPWVQDRGSAVRELARVVAPGGHVLLTMDNSRSLNRLLDPGLNPLLLPVKHLAADFLCRAGLRRPEAVANFCSNRAINRVLGQHGLQKVWSATVGFGPLTLCGRPVLGDARAKKLNQRLQGMADRNQRWIRNAGAHYLVLAQKGR